MALDIFEKDFIRDVKFIKEELIDEAEVGEINELFKSFMKGFNKGALRGLQNRRSALVEKKSQEDDPNKKEQIQKQIDELDKRIDAQKKKVHESIEKLMAGDSLDESSFTRQHFTKIADIVKTIKNTDDKQGVVDKLVDMFKKDNSLFDEDKFRSYIEK